MTRKSESRAFLHGAMGKGYHSFTPSSQVVHRALFHSGGELLHDAEMLAERHRLRKPPQDSRRASGTLDSQTG